MSKSISFDDPDIVSFFENNPHLNAVEIIKAFIEIMKSLSTDMTKTFQNTKLGEISSALDSVKSGLTKGFEESRKEIQEEVRRTISSNSMSQTKEINSFVERNTSTLGDRVLSNQRQENLNSISDHLSNQVSQPIMCALLNTEKRTKSEIDKLAEDLLLQRKDGEKLSTELWDFLNKYKHSSSTKGAVSENMLCDLLNGILPTDEVIDCTGITASGDFIVNRKDSSLPKFLVENKDYTRKATTAEVVKFERDVQEQKCHGIFLSQSSEITFKDPYQVDLIDGFIHVYVPNVNFEPSKVKTAIDIIDQLSKAIELVERSNTAGTSQDITISKAELELVAAEYKAFAEKRTQALDSARAALNVIEESFSLPCLQSLLNGLGKAMPDSLTCRFCNIYTGKNKSALAAHTRRCKFNPKSPSYEPPKTGEPSPCPPAPIENVNLSI